MGRPGSKGKGRGRSREDVDDDDNMKPAAKTARAESYGKSSKNYKKQMKEAELARMDANEEYDSEEDEYDCYNPVIGSEETEETVTDNSEKTGGSSEGGSNNGKSTEVSHISMRPFVGNRDKENISGAVSFSTSTYGGANSGGESASSRANSASSRDTNCAGASASSRAAASASSRAPPASASSRASMTRQYEQAQKRQKILGGFPIMRSDICLWVKTRLWSTVKFLDKEDLWDINSRIVKELLAAAKVQVGSEKFKILWEEKREKATNIQSAAVEALRNKRGYVILKQKGRENYKLMSCSCPGCPVLILWLFFVYLKRGASGRGEKVNRKNLIWTSIKCASRFPVRRRCLLRTTTSRHLQRRISELKRRTA